MTEALTRIVICGAGDRAFCAGGDIRWLYERGLAGDYAAQSEFFREEYTLNARIKRFPKPYVSLIDGIVMGGGVGVSLHGSHRVATEKAVFAMPEVGIGFFPDVGATYALPRLPHRVGVAMAATGLRANGADMAALGLATAFVESRKLPSLAEALERPGDIDAIIGEFATAPPPSKLFAEAATLEHAFAQADAASVEAALQAEDSEFARRLIDMMATKSPTSLAIALRQMHIGATLSFEQAMAVEFRIVTRVCRGHDFYEGVRAAIVDKDNSPQWRPASGERPEDARHRRVFRPARRRRTDAARRCGLRYQMRQSRDGVIRIVDQSPRPAGSDRFSAVFPNAVETLVWFMRTMACVWVAKGLFNWAVLMGLNPRFGDFTMLPRALQTTIVFFAGADLLGAIGMWLAAPWGGVLWLLCASLEAISPLLGGRAALLGVMGVALNVILIGLYFTLKWRADHQRR